MGIIVPDSFAETRNLGEAVFSASPGSSEKLTFYRDGTIQHEINADTSDVEKVCANLRKISPDRSTPIGNHCMHRIGHIPYVVIQANKKLRDALNNRDMKTVKEFLKEHPEFQTTNKKF